ncbi:DUF523 and DUF1722 domain-containing protein [candidate division WOR-3 bacterium]|nr:DUF523 and DUF1722 domain-containing protein [candidate division WOR-3 bacterium]
MKPSIFASKCLGFDTCRYNGVTIYDDFIEKLKPHVDYITACPEMEIGLGVPREPVRIVLVKGVRRLKQPATRKDITDLMLERGKAILDNLPEVEGFILKSRSPSCGIKDTKYFPKIEKSAALGRGAGFFGAAVLERFSKHPIEDEGRIKNYRIREHFLTRVFTLARFRGLNPTMSALVRFHTDHKLLLMAYSQKYLKILGSIVANHDKLRLEEVCTRYYEHLLDAMLRPPRYTATINVLMHQYGYFRRLLTPREKKYFFDTLERYRREKVPLSAVLMLINAWIVRYEEEYLARQRFFQPYPEALVEITDSGKGRSSAR